MRDAQASGILPSPGSGGELPTLPTLPTLPPCPRTSGEGSDRPLPPPPSQPFQPRTAEDEEQLRLVLELSMKENAEAEKRRKHQIVFLHNFG